MKFETFLPFYKIKSTLLLVNGLKCASRQLSHCLLRLCKWAYQCLLLNKLLLFIDNTDTSKLVKYDECTTIFYLYMFSVYRWWRRVVMLLLFKTLSSGTRKTYNSHLFVHFFNSFWSIFILKTLPINLKRTHYFRCWVFFKILFLFHNMIIKL